MLSIAVKVLTASEIRTILSELKRKAEHDVNAFQDLIIFRLATCCGLRVCEIVGLNTDDVVLEGRPHIVVRKEIAKGKKKRRVVPLWWDKGTLEDITAWVSGMTGPMVRGKQGRLQRRMVQYRYKRCLKIVGRENTHSIHGGRHSFVSHALNGKRSLAEVRDAAGHHSLEITSIYAHCVGDDGSVGTMF